MTDETIGNHRVFESAIDSLATSMAESNWRQMDRAIQPILERIAALEERIAALEAKTVSDTATDD